MQVDSYAYLPPNFKHSLKCDGSATLVVFERRCIILQQVSPSSLATFLSLFNIHGVFDEFHVDQF